MNVTNEIFRKRDKAEYAVRPAKRSNTLCLLDTIAKVRQRPRETKFKMNEAKKRNNKNKIKRDAHKHITQRATMKRRNVERVQVRKVHKYMEN